MFAQLEPHAQLLTPNRRLSRFVLGAYDAWQQSSGREAWVSSRPLAWDDWLLQLWQQVQAKALLPQAQCVLLSASQSAQVWLRVLQAHSGGYALLQPESMAPLAAQAWCYVQDWCVSLAQVPGELEETQLWLAWAQAFEQELLANNWLDIAQLPALLMPLCDAGVLALPPQLILLGFDEFSPSQTALLRRLEQAGVRLERPDIALAGQVQRLGLASSAEELPAAVRWAWELVQQAGAAPPRIGIVIPDLPQRRLEVEREFTRWFEPQYWLLDNPRHAPGFNLSVAQPLGQTPLISAALDVLALRPGKLPEGVIQRLLISPFVGSEAELGQRCQWAAQLTAKYAAPQLRHWQQCMLRPRGAGRAGASEEQGDMAQRLLAWQQHRRLLPKARQAASLWAQVFSEQLSLWGWPGERNLDSLEYQQLALWPGILAQLAALDWVEAPMTRQQALAHLQRLTYTPFAAQTEDSPIQVLGVLEAAGQHFDYLWVMQMEARAWPPAAAPNPLLPVAWQRQLAMPRSGADKELALAQRLTQRFAGAAAEVIFSYGLREGDQPLQPSPLIVHWPEMPVAAAGAARPDYAALLQQARPVLEDWQDDQAPAFNPAQEPLRGGSQILKDQAACGFRAFVRHRLQARVAPPAQWGVSAALRGNLLHAALEMIWIELGSQAQLLALEEAALESLLMRAIDHAWRRTDPELLQSAGLRSVESQRMARLLRAWLELDKQRPPFTVLSQEGDAELILGSLTLKLRSDRIDLLPDGGRVVIDYKTGENSIAAWLGERPDDPQVPLYCLGQPEVVAAAYGQLRLELLEYLGLTAMSDLLPNLKTPADYDDADMPADWTRLIAQWRLTLGALAEEFAEGQAAVEPKCGLMTCQYCDLQSLCRYHQRLELSESSPPIHG